jgi:hypothetical protein
LANLRSQPSLMKQFFTDSAPENQPLFPAPAGPR